MTESTYGEYLAQLDREVMQARKRCANEQKFLLSNPLLQEAFITLGRKVVKKYPNAALSVSDEYIASRSVTPTLRLEWEVVIDEEEGQVPKIKGISCNVEGKADKSGAVRIETYTPDSNDQPYEKSFQMSDSPAKLGRILNVAFSKVSMAKSSSNKKVYPVDIIAGLYRMEEYGRLKIPFQ